MPVVALRNLQRAVRVDLDLLLRQAVALRNSLTDGAFSDHHLTVSLVSNSHMRRLNARYARADHVTDVLSFRTADPPRAARAAHHPDIPDVPLDAPIDVTPDLGTIFLAVPLCARRAARRSIPTNHYLVAATAHATAHLGGHVHNDAPTRAAMYVEELRLLRAAAAVTGRGDEAVAFPRSYMPAC